MAKLGFMVTRSLSASTGSRTLSLLAAAALEKEHNVCILFAADGVYQCMRKQKRNKENDSDFLQKLQKFVYAGADVLVSSPCLESRGVAIEDVCNGVRVVTFEEIAKMAGQADQVVCL
ncbi:MAG: DsrE family protein [Candidatus Bruticola sp.]